MAFLLYDLSASTRKPIAFQSRTQPKHSTDHRNPQTTNPSPSMLIPSLPRLLLPGIMLVPLLRLVRAHNNVTPGDPMFTSSMSAPTFGPTPTPTHVQGPTATVDNMSGPLTSRRHVPHAEDLTEDTAGPWAVITGFVACPQKIDPTADLIGAWYTIRCIIPPADFDTSPTFSHPSTFHPVHSLVPNDDDSDEFTFPVLCPPIDTYPGRWIEASINCGGPFAPAKTSTTVSTPSATTSVTAASANVLVTPSTTSSTVVFATTVTTAVAAPVMTAMSLEDYIAGISTPIPYETNHWPRAIPPTCVPWINLTTTPSSPACASHKGSAKKVSVVAHTGPPQPIAMNSTNFAPLVSPARPPPPAQVDSPAFAPGFGRKRARPEQGAEVGESVKAGSTVMANRREQLFKDANLFYNTVSTRLAGFLVGPFHGHALEIALRRLRPNWENETRPQGFALDFGLRLHVSLLDAQPELPVVKHASVHDEDLMDLCLTHDALAVCGNTTLTAHEAFRLPQEKFEVIRPRSVPDVPVPTVNSEEPATVPSFVLVATTNLYLGHADVWSEEDLRTHRDKRARYRAEYRYQRLKAKVQRDAAERSRSRVKASVRQSKATRASDKTALVSYVPPVRPRLVSPSAMAPIPSKSMRETSCVETASPHFVFLAGTRDDPSRSCTSANDRGIDFLTALPLLYKASSHWISLYLRALLIDFTYYSRLAWKHLAMPLVTALFAQFAIGLHAIVSDVLAEAIAPWIPCLATCVRRYLASEAPLAVVIFDVVTTVMYRAIANVRTCPLVRQGERIGWHIFALIIGTLTRCLPGSMVWPTIGLSDNVALPQPCQSDPMDVPPPVASAGKKGPKPGQRKKCKWKKRR